MDQSTQLETLRTAVRRYDIPDLAPVSDLMSSQTGLSPTRIVDVHTNTARAHLDLGDREGAQPSRVQAWTVAPRKATVHPMSRDVLRVLISLRRRSKPQLLTFAKQAGLPA